MFQVIRNGEQNGSKNQFNLELILILIKTKKLDFYGVLYTIHCALFFKDLEVEFDESSKKFTTNCNFKRTYKDVFNKIFDIFLNIPSNHKIPNLDGLIKDLATLHKGELPNLFNSDKQYLIRLEKDYAPPYKTREK